MKTIDERTEFLKAVLFTPNELCNQERILEWLRENPDDAANYIVWLEKYHGGDQ